MHKPLAALALAGSFLLPSIAVSQTPAPQFEVRGHVLDAATGAPVEGAVVELRDVRRKAAADSAGEFVVRGVVAGTHHWVITRLGYAAWEEDAEVADGDDEFTIRLLPRAEVLEGITAVADRLSLRRNASGVTVHTLERTDIKLTAATDALQLVGDRLALHAVPCAGEGATGGLSCAWVRGELIPVTVYIDEQRAVGGLGDLAYYLPQELYAIEVYQGGAMVRVITDTFAARLARGGATLLPLRY